ncbi:putative ribonuclease H protein [Citrus sinensis]|uniref:Ribonuclease H protein n=1 Tax=Citrus sinensis TaxID=2711 RepID=A0ACB8M0F9_CITSI|nr:putative ribonuclease H protein [Citrus sinensis]
MDTIFWAHSKHGEFTTSSAYLALSGYNSAAEDRTWRLIWTWKGPQSMRVFLWQAFHAGLKTKAELARRHLLTSTCCDRCGALCEDALHALRDCPLVKQFWLNIIPISERQGFFNARFHHWLHSNLVDDSRMGDVLSWAFLFNQTKMNCSALLVDVHSRAKETHKLHNSPLVTRSIRINKWISWHPPKWPWCTLNTDGAHKSDEISTAGGLIRDHLGRWISGFGMVIGSCSITVAELWGLYKGLKLAWDSGIRRLKVETDSLCVTQLVARSSVMTNEYAPLVQAIKDYLKLDWHVSIVHIYREANFSLLGT